MKISNYYLKKKLSKPTKFVIPNLFRNLIIITTLFLEAETSVAFGQLDTKSFLDRFLFSYSEHRIL